MTERSIGQNTENEIFKGKRILFVDDEDSIKELYTLFLSRYGVTVVPASNGQEAWDILQSQQFDLVITDQDMPVMKGDEFIRKIREGGFSIPVLLSSGRLFSGGNQEVDNQTAKNKGANAGFAKPFQIQDLLSSLRTLLQNPQV